MADETVAVRYGFELCADGDDWNSGTVQFWTRGHIVEPTLEDQRDLMRAIAYECGMGGLANQVRSAAWHRGYTGRVAGVYDLVPCDENGVTNQYGDDGEELIAQDVEPVTWATVQAMTATVEAARLSKLFIHTDPHAHAFAFSHYQAGHRYTVMGDKGSMSVECQCGKRYVAGSNTVEYP